ncbi:MAG: hypothetical protein AAGN35_18495 [Bacteroidota bacterium]
MAYSGKSYRIEYEYRFQNGDSERLVLNLDPDTMAFRVPEGIGHPEWTRLENAQCGNCPLLVEDHPYCPVATNLQSPIQMFSQALSHDAVELHVVTPERKYEVQTTMQKAIGALLGIVMVTSGCPILDPLRPMVRFHLPVATLDETKYRAISMYLVAQYLRRRKGLKADWDMKNLISIYDEISKVNKAFVRRLQQAVEQDAGLNAVVALNYFADLVPFAIDEGELDDLEDLFSAYLD